MSLSYVKPKKQKNRLEVRQSYFEKLQANYKGRGNSPYTKPGSMNK